MPATMRRPWRRCWRAPSAARTATACCSGRRWRSRSPARSRATRGHRARRGRHRQRRGGRACSRRCASAGRAMSGGFLEEMAQASRARVRAAQALRSVARARAAPRRPRHRRHDCGWTRQALISSPNSSCARPRRARCAVRTRTCRGGSAPMPGPVPRRSRCSPSRSASTARSSTCSAPPVHSPPPGVPAMRKDFLVDPYQVLEARAAGAGGVLVILRMLPRAATEALIECAGACELFVLLEAFDAADIALMHELVAHFAPDVQLLAGLNCRDLGTLQVVPGRLARARAAAAAGGPARGRERRGDGRRCARRGGGRLPAGARRQRPHAGRGPADGSPRSCSRRAAQPAGVR